MKYCDSPYTRQINEQFNSGFYNDAFYNLIAEIIDTILCDGMPDEDELDSEIRDAIDNGLIYTDDCWTVAENYASNPWDLDWDSCIDQLYCDIYSIVNKIKESK